MNNVHLVGRLTKDIELKEVSSDTIMTNFILAVRRDYKNKDDQYETDFIPCVAWRNNADFLFNYTEKGALIGIDGSLVTGNYEVNNKRVYTMDVQVSRIHLLASNNKKDIDL